MYALFSPALTATLVILGITLKDHFAARKQKHMFDQMREAAQADRRASFLSRLGLDVR
jgi:hypothetical protein